MGGNLKFMGRTSNKVLYEDAIIVAAKILHALNIYTPVNDHIAGSMIHGKSGDQFNDIDLLIPSPNYIVEKIHNLAFRIQNVRVVKYGTTRSSLAWYDDVKCKYYQVDLNCVGVDSNNKIEDFFRFTHSSNPIDKQIGLKGVCHKMLLRALTSVNLIKVDGKISSRWAFSVDYGFRDKFVMEDGKLKPTPTGPHYCIRSARTAYDAMGLFNLEVSSSFVETVASLATKHPEHLETVYKGLKRLMETAQTLSPDEEEHDKMVSIMYGIFDNAMEMIGK